MNFGKETTSSKIIPTKECLASSSPVGEFQVVETYPSMSDAIEACTKLQNSGAAHLTITTRPGSSEVIVTGTVSK